MKFSSIIIDRRQNPKGKSLANRTRFLERVRDSIRESDKFLQNDLAGTKDVDISVPNKGIKEPEFSYDSSSGYWDTILPGNEEFIVGDIIYKERAGSGQGNGDAGLGSGEDDFRFTMSREEYFNLLFDDLDLPDMIKKSLKNSNSFSKVRAGYTTVGQESNLNVLKTVQSSIGRRIALRGKETQELEEELEKAETEEEKQLILDKLQNTKKYNFLENVDLKYNNFTKIARPSTTAVMFCIMDVSASMDETKKLLAKKFFLLLYTFLKKKHKDIDIVFISHTEVAEEVTEKEFFYDNKNGGTIISTSYILLDKILKERYNINETNIYIAQASDGDNFGSDNERLSSMVNKLINDVQFMVYIEINGQLGRTDVWNTFLQIKHNKAEEKMELVNIREDKEIIPSFRKIFKKR